MTLEDLDLFPQPEGARPGAAPARKCRRHTWVDAALVLYMDDAGEPSRREWRQCGRCGQPYEEAAARRGRNNRSRGNRDELTVARLLGGRKVGPLGLPHDVELPGYMRLQCKRLDSWPSVARVLTWLDEMQPHDDIRGVTLADTPGPGGRTRRLLIVDLDEFARWHGRQP